MIIYHDDYLVAAAKPAGLACIPNFQTERSGTLWGQLEATVGQKLFAVHRLDKDTSGVILFAKDAATHKTLCQAFEKQTLTKIYWGICTGRVIPRELTINKPIAKRNLLTMKISSLGQPATTKVKTLEEFRDYSLLEIQPITGKRHQIRLHLQSIGHPLAIDPIYASDQPILLSSIKRRYKGKETETEKPIIARLPLHAKELHFIHPATEQPVTITAPLPKDIAYFLRILRKDG